MTEPKQETSQSVQKPKYVSVLIREKDGHSYWAVIREDHRYIATQEESDNLAQNLNTLNKITGE